MYFKEFSCNPAENMQARCVPRFIQRFLIYNTLQHTLKLHLQCQIIFHSMFVRSAMPVPRLLQCAAIPTTAKRRCTGVVLPRAGAAQFRRSRNCACGGSAAAEPRSGASRQRPRGAAFAAGESRGSCVAVRQGRCRKICGLWDNKSKAYKRKTAFCGNSCLNTQILRIFQAARRKILLQYICKSSSEERILNYEAEKNTLLGIDCDSYLLRVVVRLFDRPRRNYERRSNLHFRKRRSGNERQ